TRTVRRPLADNAVFSGESAVSNSAGLYIDLPFCIARCAFCAFHVEGFRSRWAEKYIRALHKEIEYYAALPELAEYSIPTLYLGGGTPSLYDVTVLTDLISRCRELFQVTPDAEITLEAHPATLNAKNLSRLLKGGVNRLSMGIQSFSDHDLKRLGRHHTVDQAKTAFHAARSAGFENIAIDLIFGLPEQRIRDWEETLEEALSLAPEHLSIYALSIEEGTLFAKKTREGKLALPSESETLSYYETARSVLSAAGYAQYEISNFAKPGYACRHNLLYWDQQETLGFGLAAHAYFKGERRANIEAIPAYIDAVAAGKRPLASVEKVRADKALIDKIIFGLRKTEGIPFEWITTDPVLKKTTHSLIQHGWLQKTANRIQLTSAGLSVADEVAIAYL
ncbi:MAG: radical SAM family heme chaperone HemW, partial [Nitrospiria bacterium]